MEAQGIVRVSRIERTGSEAGRPAVIYESVAARIRLARAPRKVENHPAMAQAARATAGQAVKDYERGFAAEHWQIEGPKRNHWFFRVITAPSPERLARINALLDELAELVWTPDPNPGPLMSIAWFLSPLTRPRRKSR
jgi:predicted ArsR family transcriptional regulator